MTRDANPDSLPLAGRRIAFLGKLGGVTKREAQRLVRQQGGVPVDDPNDNADLIVIGADELPLSDTDDLLNEAARQAAAAGQLEIIGETQLWQRLGMMENEQNVRRLYTPAMLADLLDVSVATIRLWHRRGLIVPARTVRRLPYFDFQEVATARRLAQLLAAGVSPAVLQKKLADLSRFVPGVERPLAQLSIIIEGRQLLLRQGAGLIEPGGQMRFDFDAFEDSAEAASSEPDGHGTLSIEQYLAERSVPPGKEDVLEMAAQFEDEGRLEDAAEMYRVALSAGGPAAETCFQLAELLYRLGDLAGARERYYMAIELDEDYVEARANLGCVLAELGQRDLAISAFQGALKYHPDFPDVHFHLGRTLDELDRHEEAETHWRAFLELAPDSPWAEEAASRLDNRS
jgi:tetratricopeptide (TPR) repeat protein